jgi:hypothetical protein
MMKDIMGELHSYGAPLLIRQDELSKKVEQSQEYIWLEFMGKNRKIPIVEVRIGFLVYRLNNVRTKTLQLEYLATHPDKPSDLFTRDHDSIEAQTAQHKILEQLVEEEGLFKSFTTEGKQQIDPIISSSNGVVVNGNRRLCTWRKLFYGNKTQFPHFETIRVGVLPECDEFALQELESQLQIKRDMRAPYVWHSLAQLAIEMESQGRKMVDIAKMIDKTTAQTRELIDMYTYAEKFLQLQGTPNQWSHVNKDEYAFREIVKGRKKLSTTAEKELFESIAYSFIEGDRTGGRLYDTISDIPEALPEISKALLSHVDTEEIQLNTEVDEMLGLSSENDATGNMAIIIAQDEKRPIARNVAKRVIDTQRAIKKEVEEENFLLNQLSKANSFVENAIKKGMSDTANTDGVKAQLDAIESNVVKIRDWLDKRS